MSKIYEIASNHRHEIFFGLFFCWFFIYFIQSVTPEFGIFLHSNSQQGKKLLVPETPNFGEYANDFANGSKVFRDGGEYVNFAVIQ